MIKKISVITAIFIAGFSLKSYSAFCEANQSISECLKKALAGYCYPNPEDCGTAYEPKYNSSDSTCSCVNETYLYYDAEERRCNPKCPAGYFLKTVEDCPAGSFKFEVK